MGFDTENEDEYRHAIKGEGGSIEKLFDWQGLYFIVSSEKLTYSDPICVKARDNGAVLVNELWLDDTLSNGALADINYILYRPPVALGGIKGAQHLNIAHTGFSCREAQYIQKLVDMIGAQNVDISNASFLICNGLEDYEASKARDVFTVNMKWLEDSAKEWEILSVDGYISWPRRAISRKYRTPMKDNTATSSKREASSTGKKVKSRTRSPEDSNSVKREASSTGKKVKSRTRSPEDSNSVERQVLSTGCNNAYPRSAEHGASFCKRRLDFNWKRLSDYKASEMVMKVHIPRSKMGQEVGTNEFKGALKGSYTVMANFHSGRECIRNTLNASSFRVSRNSEQVIMDQPQLVEYEENLALANRKQFALMVRELFKEKYCSLPDNIAGWLASIVDVDKVSDRVLKHHINMLHPIDAYGSFVSMYYVMMRMKETNFTQYLQIMNSRVMKKYRAWVQPFQWKFLNDAVQYVHPKMAELNNSRGHISNWGAIGQAGICKPKKRDPGPFGILEVVRDCFIHPAMIYQDLLLQVLFAEGYPSPLSDLQQTLFELGLLDNL